MSRNELFRRLLGAIEAEAEGGGRGRWPEWKMSRGERRTLWEDVQAFQGRENPVLARYWGALGQLPLPTDSFKDVDVVSFDLGEAVACFRSSGSTTKERGRHHFKTLALMKAAISASFSRFVLPDLRESRIFVLGPALPEAPDSSLTFMFDHVVSKWGAPGSGFFWSEGRLDLSGLARALTQAVRDGVVVTLLGASFSYVHFLDHLAKEGLRFSLPDGSRALETGGFKGKSRSVSRPTLHSELCGRFGLSPRMIVGEYGMSELSSQLYEPTLRWEALGLWVEEGARLYQPAPWCEVQVVDPLSLAPCALGEEGLVAIVDLASLDSASYLVTGDMGVLERGEALSPGLPEGAAGLRLLGRAPGARAKGCSLTLDQWMAR